MLAMKSPINECDVSESRDGMRPIRKYSVSLVGIVSLFLLGAWLLLRNWPAPIDVHAMAAFAAVESGNADRIISYARPEEAALTGLNRERLKYVLDNIYKPSLTRFNKMGPIESEVLAQGAEGVVNTVRYDELGNVIGYGIEVWDSDEGPKFSVLAHLLRSAWIARHVRERKMGGSPLPYLLAQSKGLMEDRAVLEEIGLKGIAIDNFHKGVIEFRTWAEWERGLLSRIEYHDKGLRSPTPSDSKNSQIRSKFWSAPFEEDVLRIAPPLIES
jgi:hypothetical protein